VLLQYIPHLNPKNFDTFQDILCYISQIIIHKGYKIYNSKYFKL